MLRVVSAALGATLIGHAGIAAAQIVSYPYLPDRTTVAPSSNSDQQNNLRGSRPSRTSTARPSIPPDRYATTRANNQFASEAKARSNCGTDPVVWVNMRSHRYYSVGSRGYGSTEHGAFMCRAQAKRTGLFRAAKNEQSLY
jgi:hypothetical protein